MKTWLVIGNTLNPSFVPVWFCAYDLSLPQQRGLWLSADLRTADNDSFLAALVATQRGNWNQEKMTI